MLDLLFFKDPAWVLYLKALNHNSLHILQRYMSLAICAPQSSRFFLGFALGKLFASAWEMILSVDKYFAQF